MGHDNYSRQVCKTLARSPSPTRRPEDLVAGVAFLGHSPSIERLRLQVRRVAPHLRIALITGERGTGKLQIARTLHSLSGKDADAFRQLRSPLELHSIWLDHSGNRRLTCYLPDLSTLAPLDQAELLTGIHRLEAIQPAHRRPQLIFSTTDDLRGLVAVGQFHPELYNTISSVEIMPPPLRSRPEDIPVIIATLLDSHLGGNSGNHTQFGCTHLGEMLDSRALSRLKGYGWPGNLRELSRVLALARRHARTLSGQDIPIEAMHLPPLECSPVLSADAVTEIAIERLDEIIERHVLGVLLRCSGNKVRAAERLGISRSTLYRMLEASPSTTSVVETN